MTLNILTDFKHKIAEFKKQTEIYYNYIQPSLLCQRLTLWFYDRLYFVLLYFFHYYYFLFFSSYVFCTCFSVHHVLFQYEYEWETRSFYTELKCKSLPSWSDCLVCDGSAGTGEAVWLKPSSDPTSLPSATVMIKTFI